MEFQKPSHYNSSDVHVYSSPIGQVIDVATPGTRKLKALGFLWTLITLFPFLIINYLIIQALTSDDAILTSGKVLYLLGSALMPFMAWFALGNAVQRFHAASTGERYLRVGPGGVSIRLTDDSASATFRFSLKTLKLDLPWDQVKTWYPYVESINGIPTERSIVFETVKGEKLKVKTFHFEEKQKAIAKSIDRARSLHLKVEDHIEEYPISLPSGVKEASLQIKKKRDRVKEIDLSTVPAVERAHRVVRVADAVEARLVSVCPTAEGYKHTRKQYQLYPERKNVSGVRLFVQQGLLRGYEIQVEPDDFECRKLTISICPSNLIGDIRKYVAGAIGIVFLVVSLKWMPAVQYELGELSQLTPLVMLVIVLAAVGVSAGLLQIPISLLRMLMLDSKRKNCRSRKSHSPFKRPSSRSAFSTASRDPQARRNSRPEK